MLTERSNFQYSGPSTFDQVPEMDGDDAPTFLLNFGRGRGREKDAVRQEWKSRARARGRKN